MEVVRVMEIAIDVVVSYDLQVQDSQLFHPRCQYHINNKSHHQVTTVAAEMLQAVHDPH